MEAETTSGVRQAKEVTGRVSQIIGPVVDVYFEGAENEVTLPRIHDAMTIVRDDGRKLIIEVQQHIGENTVRTVAMDSTDGLHRGMKAVSYLHPITVPIGEQVKGRLLNVVGDAIDGLKQPDMNEGAYPIHRDPPKFDELTTSQEVLYTGIKVLERRQNRPVRRRRRGQNRADHGDDQQHRQKTQRLLGVRRRRRTYPRG